MSCFAGPYNRGIVTSGLVLYYDVNEPVCYSSGRTDIQDLSRNGNVGTLVNGVGYSANNGGSLVFDGVNDYVSCPVTKTSSCSFSCWAKTSTVASNPMLFNAGANGAGPDLFFNNGKISWNTWNGDTNPFCTMPATVTNGQWHNYVVVNDASSNAKLYYDGVLIGTATYRNASVTTNLYIGGTTATYMWNGSISSFLVHNKVLSSEEIQQNFNAHKDRFGL